MISCTRFRLRRRTLSKHGKLFSFYLAVFTSFLDGFLKGVVILQIEIVLLKKGQIRLSDPSSNGFPPLFNELQD